MHYATFWERLGAILLDWLFLTPLTALRFWLESVSKQAAIAFLVPFSCLHLGYFVSYDAVNGQTPGKRLMGIRIVKRNGDPIGWHEAWLRNSFTIIFVLVNDVAILLALTAIADPDYYNVGWTVRNQNLNALRPAWIAWPETLGTIWTWSEVIVMLLNRERRSLHDFIAGTVVIKHPRASNDTEK